MNPILTFKLQRNKRNPKGISNSHYIFFLNGVEILKQKVPYEDDYSPGHDHHTGLENVYYLNGKIYQDREKFGKVRNVSFPVSKNRLSELNIPKDLKIEMTWEASK